MNGNKKYWIFWSKWTLIYMKNGELKFELKRMEEYWILFFAKFILSNNVIKLNNDWSKL